MPGSRLPVVNVEKLRLEAYGRGLVIDDDATQFDVSSWTGTSGGAVSTKKFLPAPSATAWWKVTDDAGNSYYIPLFSTKC